MTRSPAAPMGERGPRHRKGQTMDTSSKPVPPRLFDLVFVPLHHGCSFAFPCNETGVVEMNDLTEQARNNYLLARALVGRDFQVPSVVPRHG
jgi:hypothetical protein